MSQTGGDRSRTRQGESPLSSSPKFSERTTRLVDDPEGWSTRHPGGGGSFAGTEYGATTAGWVPSNELASERWVRRERRLPSDPLRHFIAACTVQDPTPLLSRSHNDHISVMLTRVNQNSAWSESADGRSRTILPTLAEK